MSTRARMIRRLLIFLSIFSFVSGSWAQQDISTDPFLQKKINREHWAPGGQHYPSHFPIRGPTIEQTGQVNIHPLHTQRLGTYKLQNADVRGQYGFVIDLRSQHGHNVHAPFDYASKATKTFREDRKDGGQSSIEFTSQGSFVHPANGYDPPAGGGFPPPDPRGAIDLVDFSINGIATGVYPLSLSEQQKSDIAPGLSGDALADRASNAFKQAYESSTDQLRRAVRGHIEAGIASDALVRIAVDTLRRGDPSNSAGIGRRLRDFVNGKLDLALGTAGSVVYGLGGLVGGAFEPELIAAGNTMGNAAVSGFKRVDVRTQYAGLQTSSDLENLLETYPEIGKIVEGAGYFVAVGGAVKAVKAVKASKSAVNLTKSQQKSIGTLKNRITEHKQKLDAYKRNPDAFDNKEFLKNAPNEQVRQRIIDGRVRHLEKEIQDFQKGIDDILKSGGG